MKVIMIAKIKSPLLWQIENGYNAWVWVLLTFVSLELQENTFGPYLEPGKLFIYGYSSGALGGF